MTMSLIRKTPLIIQPNSKVDQARSFSQKISFPVDRSGGVISELSMDIFVSAAFLVDIVPAALDVRHIIDRVNVRTSDGDIVSLTGPLAWDLVRLHEKNSTPVVTLGGGAGAVSTVRFNLELHFEMDGAVFDLLTAVLGDKVSKFDVEVVLASQAHVQGMAFPGATFAAVPAYSVLINPAVYSYPALSSDQFGQNVGSQIQFQTTKEDDGTTVGRKTIELDPSNLTREILIHVLDETAGADAAVFSDAIITDVVLKQGNRILRQTTWPEMRQYSERKHDFNAVGAAVLSWGDYDEGFCPLTKDPVQLELTVAVGAPAWRIQAAQVYKRDRSALTG